MAEREKRRKREWRVSKGVREKERGTAIERDTKRRAEEERKKHKEKETERPIERGEGS